MLSFTFLNPVKSLMCRVSPDTLIVIIGLSSANPTKHFGHVWG